MAETNVVDPDDHIGRSFDDLSIDVAEGVAVDIESVFATGQPIAERLVIGETPAAPGIERHWLVSYFPIRPGPRTRSSDGTFDPGLMARSLAAARGEDAKGIVALLDNRVVAFEQGAMRDDMALLVIRVRPGDDLD